MFNLVKHGDPTTTGGFVIATLSRMVHHGVQLAVAGDRATCGNCKGTWPIVASGKRMFDKGRAIVLDRDWVACLCHENRVMAQSDNMIYHRARGEAHTEADIATTAATTQRPTAATSPADIRQKTTERRCVLHIGVFFDGTGNNASNTALFEQCKASTGSALNQQPQDMQSIAEHCKPYMLKTDSSYEGGYTNVWRLYQLYRDSSDGASDSGADLFAKIYIDGIGTTAGKPDTLIPGYLFGTGETGMIERVKQTISAAIPQQINVFGQRYPDVVIEAIEFDVFGFSRGAAAARHFVNEINRKQDSLLATALRYINARLADTFQISKDTRVGFVGLFDTVVSRASIADGFNIRAGDSGPLQVGLPSGCARQVVQIAARDEHRANFMLTSVTPQHRQIKLPGVHSDIGGGYNQSSEGPLMLIEPMHSVESLDLYESYRADKSNLMQSKAWREAEKQRQMWKQRLGGIRDDYLTVEGWMVLQHRQTSHAQIVKQPVPLAYATIRLQRPIDPSYQLIALRVMHKLARDKGVALDAIDDNDPNYKLPVELKPISYKLLAGQSLSAEEEMLVAREYLHQSANWNFGRGDYTQSGVSLNLLYPNRPERGEKRTELPNV
jgi:uncharacterized Zn-binding protein involved in type VI secretion